MATEYDIVRAFKRIENDLMDSMMRNLERHQVEESEIGLTWEQWQAIQLSELEEFRHKNPQLFGGDFSDINNSIDDLYRQTMQNAQAQEEARLLEQIKQKKFTPAVDKGAFFQLNEGKLNALITATQSDFARAEYAMLRKADDEYRKIIFDSMTYANVTNDYKKAVDMATHDFLKAGINSVVYKNGARHTVSDYASMALRTGNKRAYLMGEGNAHDKYGLHTVRVNKRQDACPKCVGFLGRLLVDDVYGGGTRKEAVAQGIPTLSDAIQAGFLHPNCKDMYSVYIEGVSRPADSWTPGEIQQITDDYNLQQQIKHAQDTADTYTRMAKYSLDPANVSKYEARASEWQQRVADLKAMIQPVTPPAPPTKTYTAQGKTKTYTMKGLTNAPKGKGVSWQMKLNPNLNDLTEQIKAVEQVPNTEVVLKILYQNAIDKAEAEKVKLKANGAKFYDFGHINKKQKTWQKKLDILNLNDDINTLNTEIADLEAQKTASLPADKVYSGIWKQDVKLSEYAQYEAKINDKFDYYIDKIDEWNTKGVSVYGKTQAEVDAKVKELTDYYMAVSDFSIEGSNYQNIAESFDKQIKAKKDALDKAKDDLDALVNPKKKKKGKNGLIDYDSARRAKAPLLTDEREADKKLRPLAGKSWQRANKAEKRAIYEYTEASGRFNHPLYFKDSLDKNTGYGSGWGDKIRNMTRLIMNGEPLTFDMTMIRGTSWEELAQIGAFGMTKADIKTLAGLAPYMTEAELKKTFVGRSGRLYNFLSSSPVEGHGFAGSKPVRVRIFAPKDTEGFYAEPISYYGGNNAGSSVNGLAWDGVADANYINYEQEFIFQRGGWYEIVDIRKSGGYIEVDYVHHPEMGYERYGM